MTKSPIYIDTDMGADDIVAICMLARSGLYDIRGVSVVNGVATLRSGVRNASSVLTALGLTCPIFVGANQRTQKSTLQFPVIDRVRASTLTPLVRVPLPKGANSLQTTEALARQISGEPQPIPLFCIGPLTNVAKLVSISSVQKNIFRLIIMGGSLNCPGNVSPRFASEYNFRLDSIAVRTVLSSKIPITLIPMDATKCVPARKKLSMGKTRTALRSFCKNLSLLSPQTIDGQIIKRIIQNNRNDFDYFYDPLAAAILLNPAIVVRQQPVCLSVRTSGSFIGKIFLSSKKSSVINVITNVDSFLFYEQLLTCVKGGETS